MKKIVLIVVFLLYLSCPLETDLDLSCLLEQTATTIKLESTLLGEDEEAFVSLVWTWLLTRPSGGVIIIERSIADASNYQAIDTLTQIDSVMYYVDNDTVLESNTDYYYRLGFLKDAEINYFKTTSATIPESQHFYAPASDTLGDTLEIAFAALENFSGCSITIFKGMAIDPESLLSLPDTLYQNSIDYPETTLIIPLPDSIFPNLEIYTIKISSSMGLELITDTSIGFRAFFKKPSIKRF